MGLRSALRATIAGSSGFATPEQWIVKWIDGGIDVASGVRVDEQTALQYGPFFAGVRVISEDLGGLPLPVYERLNRGKRRALEHPLYRVLHDQANQYMSAVAFRETLQAHALIWGTGYANVERNGAGEVVALWPLRPDRIRRQPVVLEEVPGKPGRVNLLYLYQVSAGEAPRILFPDEVFRIHGLGPDGISGYSIVELARQSIGLGLATEQFGAAFFGNGARAGGVLTHPDAVSDDARRRMRTDWENLHRGLDRSHRIAILEEGVTWQQIGVPNDDAQFLETRKFGVTEQARWLRLPPHKIGDLERATFSNIEQQQLDYVASALRIWLVRWEQAILSQLFMPSERSRWFAEHLLDALLRGDTAARYAAYAVGRNWGWLSADDVLELENRNPLPGGRGSVYLVPLNMVPAPTPAEAAAALAPKPAPELPPPAPEDEAGDQADEDNPRGRARTMLRGRSTEARRRVGESFAPLIAETDERLARLERAEVQSLVRRHLGRSRSIGEFLGALGALYAVDGLIAGRSSKAWLPLLTTFAGEIVADAAADVGHEDDVDLSIWVKAYTLSHVAYRVASAFGQLRKLVTGAGDDPDKAAEAVLGRLDTWVAERPGRTAKWEGNQLPNAAARETWRVAGVKTLKWVASGKTCPYCTHLDGRTVGIEKAFLSKGDALSDGDEKLTAGRTIHHPPVHPGCDCQIVPA